MICVVSLELSHISFFFLFFSKIPQRDSYSRSFTTSKCATVVLHLQTLCNETNYIFRTIILGGWSKLFLKIRQIEIALNFSVRNACNVLEAETMAIDASPVGKEIAFSQSSTVIVS